MIYTLSELMKVTKQDMGIKDLPPIISDEDMVDRFKTSALKTFSILSPMIIHIIVSDQNIVKEYPKDIDQMNSQFGNYVYEIPKSYYIDTQVVGVYAVQPYNSYGFYSDPLYDYMNFDAESAMMQVALTRLNATIASTVTRSITFRFIEPNRVKIFGSSQGGSYEVKIGLVHDASLSTIPNSQANSLRKLTLLDMEEYFYNTFKRKDKVNVGVGDYDLKIDDWADAAQKKEDLIDKWEEDANLGVEEVEFH